MTGGSASSVAALCKGLASAGHQVCLLTTLWPEGEKIAEAGIKRMIDGYEVYLFPYERGRAGNSLPHSPALLNALDLYSNSADITICHSLWNPIATFAMQRLRQKEIPYAVMAHGMLDPLVMKRKRWKKIPWSMLWEKKNIESAILVLFNSEAERDKAQLCGWKFNESFIMPHLIDLPYWAELPPRNALHQSLPQIRNCEVVLYVGRLNWVKNLDKLVDALKLVRRKRATATLLCVGPDDNGEKKRLESQARSLGMADHVLFTGLIEGEDLKAAYGCANVLALVSQKENFGLTVADALAAGLPVVVSDGVDIAAGWSSAGPVRRVKPQPQAISQAIVDLLERGEKHGLPDAEARSLAEREWGKNRVPQLVDTYEATLRAKDR